jgi:uncharacterized membrane protein YeiH
MATTDTRLLRAIDLVGTFALAIQGAAVAAIKDLDALGIIVVSLATALVVVDAAGLSLLAVAGAEKALEYKLTPAAAIMMGALTGVGGFTIRDILLAEVPAVRRVDFLASAALIGAAALVIARAFRVSPERAALLGGAICFLLRVAAVWRHWQLPTAHLH